MLAVKVVARLSRQTVLLRGINDSIPGNQNMQWSAVAKVVIAKPTFSIVAG